MRIVIVFAAVLALTSLGGGAAMADEPTAARFEAAPPAGSPVARHGALATSGNRVVGADGEPVTLRGMSLFWSQWAPRYYARETIDWLAEDWKVDVVRAAIAAQGPDSALTQFDREMGKASLVIEAAAANGIYVVVDWHAHTANPDEAERFLTEIARRYGHLPNVIYEPFNEPLREGVDWSRDIKPYHQRIVAAIRAIDPDNLIVVGSPSWSQDVDIAAGDPLAGDNIVYTLHYYAATHKDELRARAETARQAGLPLMITEFGVVEATGDGPIDLASSEAWWDWAEANGISWMAWSINDKDETSAALKPGTPISEWTEDDLTETGRLLRKRIRDAAAAESR